MERNAEEQPRREEWVQWEGAKEKKREMFSFFMPLKSISMCANCGQPKAHAFQPLPSTGACKWSSLDSRARLLAVALDSTTASLLCDLW